MDIEVGGYIKTKDGYIGKLKKIMYDELEKENYYICDEIMANGFIDNIKKYSKNIIGLIEERRFCEWHGNRRI